MAEKTMILRPTASTLGGSAYVSLNPSDTTAENAYLLVNEHDADDDATYVTISNFASSLKLDFDLPDERNIISATGRCRARGTGTTRATYFNVSLYPPEGSTLETANLGSCNTAPGTGDWEDYEVAIELTEFLTTINNPEYTRLRLHFSTGASPGTQKSTYTPADITQVYVVLTYDDGETTTAPLYLRENGTWTAVEGTVYQKVDGAWVESGADVFQEGDAYGLVTL